MICHRPLQATVGAGMVGLVPTQRSTLDPDAIFVGLAILAMALFAVVVSWQVVGDPYQMSMTYREAALGWIRCENLYTADIAGFLYPPQFAFLYAPFALLPLVFGELLVRYVMLGLLLLSFGQLAKTAQRSMVFKANAHDQRQSALKPAKKGWGGLMLLMTVMSMPALYQNAVAGQATIVLLALLVLATVQLVERRWWAAALLLALAVVIKPIALAALGLAGVIYLRTMWWRLLIVGSGFVLLPLAIGPFDYVWWQYEAFISKLLHAGAPPLPRWHDIRGLIYLGGAGIDPPESLLLAARGLAALGALVLCWIVRRRVFEPWAAIFLLAIAVSYLVLFNPRSENFTYLLIMPPLVLYWVRAIFHDRSWAVGLLLSLVWLGILARYELVGTDAWLTPLLGFVFLGVVVRQGFRPSAEGDGPHHLDERRLL